MGERKIYSCDWCEVDAPKPNEIPASWHVIGHNPSERICVACWDARQKALIEAKSSRRPKRSNERG